MHESCWNACWWELHGGSKDTATYSGMRYVDGVSTEILYRGDGMGLLKGQNRSQVGSMVGFCIRFWVWVCDMAGGGCAWLENGNGSC